MKQLSIDEKLEIRNKAKAEINRISNIENSEQFVENMKKIEVFKNKFLKCKRAYKIILQVHQKNKNREYNLDRLKIDMRQVPDALNYVGYNFDTTLLDRLFGTYRNGTYRKLHFFSAKDIRNNLSHAFEQKYIDELIHRYNELNKDMDTFLNTILEFDDVA